MTLKLSHVNGGYSNLLILRDLSFEINSGEVVALMGLNGAGKSTTIKHIMGILTPISGEITLDGVSRDRDFSVYEKQIAYVPEQPVFYRQLTLEEHLDLVMNVYDQRNPQTQNRAQKLLEMFRLDDKRDWLPIHFSKGMQQKMLLTCAFMLDSKLIVIDEPFVGLDPVAIDDLLNLIHERKKQGKAILISTHILNNAQNVADRFILLKQGKIKVQGNLKEINNYFSLNNASLENIYLKIAKGEL
ncbi:MAG: ABC transporter ATP-binding protein [Bombilactobacillus mellifer]|nr:ABC transporter ATP-binding protein [Bombilactobacillus mellifer]